MIQTRAGPDQADMEGQLQLSPMPLAIVDVPSSRLTAVNGAFADLLQLDTSRVPGLDFYSLTFPDRRPLVECVLAAVTSGVMESCQCRARMRLPSGEGLEVLAWLRPLEGRPEGRTLLAVVPTEASQRWDPQAMTAPDSPRLVTGTVDHDWRFRDLSPDAQFVLGWDPEHVRGTSLQSAVHPDDGPLLLLALGRGAVERRGVTVELRVQTSGDAWAPVHMALSPLCEHNPPRFSVAVWPISPGGDTESAEDRASRLEGHLWRIGLELRAADVGRVKTTSSTWWGHPALRGLSERQLEVLRRLLVGESVRSIARELYLSESTVRNHLSAIYRRLGVHSRQELIARLRDSGIASTD